MGNEERTALREYLWYCSRKSIDSNKGDVKDILSDIYSVRMRRESSISGNRFIFMKGIESLAFYGTKLCKDAGKLYLILSSKPLYLDI